METFTALGLKIISGPLLLIVVVGFKIVEIVLVFFWGGGGGRVCENTRDISFYGPYVLYRFVGGGKSVLSFRREPSRFCPSLPLVISGSGIG